MRILAYCAQGLVDTVRWASTVEPRTSPPITALTLDPHIFESNDLLYFNLHGLRDSEAWYGGGTYQGDVAVTAAQIKSVDLGQAVVFVAGCNLFYDGQRSPMLNALVAANAGWIIGGGEANYTTIGNVKLGADLLGFTLVRLLKLGIGVERAFHWAKNVVKVTPRPPEVTKEDYERLRDDTLAFNLIRGEEHGRETGSTIV